MTADEKQYLMESLQAMTDRSMKLTIATFRYTERTKISKELQGVMLEYENYIQFLESMVRKLGTMVLEDTKMPTNEGPSTIQ